LSKTTTPGLVIACIVSGLGLFISPGLSSPLLFPWVIGYLFLALRISYDAYVIPDPLKPFPFIVLGVILVNFLVQVTGGVHSSLWPVYFLYAVVVAAFSPPRRAYGMVAVILAIESANLLLTGQDVAGRWHVYAGSGLSLAGVSATASHVMHRIRSEAEEVRDAHDRLIAHAEAYNPLADTDKLESLTREHRQAANVKAASELESWFSGLVEMASDLVPAHTYALFVSERRDAGEAFTLRAVRTESPGSVLPPGAALAPHARTRINVCAEQQEVLYLTDPEETITGLDHYRSDGRGVPVRSLLLLPIVQKDRTLAVLAVDSLQADAFPRRTQDVLERLSTFFIHFSDKVQTTLELDARVRHFSALHEISRDLNESLWFGNIMKKVIPRITQLVPYDYCACVLSTEIDSVLHLQFIALEGYDDELVGVKFPLSDSAVVSFMHRHWAETGVPFFYTGDYGDRGRDIALFPFKAFQKPMRTLYGSLLVAKGTFVGAFFLASRQPNAFTKYERDSLLDTLMNQVAMVAYNSLLYQKIENMARTDGLTGLLNHRTFMEKLAEKYRELERTPRPFSLLIMDIDKFKLVNDKYGHPVGDVAIKAVAQVLRDTVRGTDFVARHGGEEFAVGMVETDIRGAELMAERVRSIMEKTMITRVHDGELRCTLSIGVVSFPEDTDKMADLVSFADEALYHAKRSGRNRVSLYRDSLKNPVQQVQS
jgi:diguanylate cyclase (GGDEF)-like protein